VTNHRLRASRSQSAGKVRSEPHVAISLRARKFRASRRRYYVNSTESTVTKVLHETEVSQSSQPPLCSVGEATRRLGLRRRGQDVPYKPFRGRSISFSCVQKRAVQYSKRKIAALYDRGEQAKISPLNAAMSSSSKFPCERIGRSNADIFVNVFHNE